MHSKVRQSLARYLNNPEPKDGLIGKWLDGVETNFFAIPFPHGNGIGSEYKIGLYREIKTHILAR